MTAAETNMKYQTHTRGQRGLPGQAGFTLLLAALVSSIVLALGSAIFSIAQKQLTLSSIGRDSQFAFYAADTAAECALYWDFRCNYFATSTSAISPSCTIPTPPGPTCVGKPLNAAGRPPEGSPNPYPYTMLSAEMDLFTEVTPGDFCAQVSVQKSLDENNAVRTIIRADGYNVGCAELLTSDRALQRSVQLEY